MSRNPSDIDNIINGNVGISNNELTLIKNNMKIGDLYNGNRVISKSKFLFTVEKLMYGNRLTESFNYIDVVLAKKLAKENKLKKNQ